MSWDKTSSVLLLTSGAESNKVKIFFYKKIIFNLNSQIIVGQLLFLKDKIQNYHF